MPGMLDEINKKQARLKPRLESVRDALQKWRLNIRTGKEMGINLPPELRARLDKQCLIWGAMTLKQMVGACIQVGLREIEELGVLEESKKQAQLSGEPQPAVARRRSLDQFVAETLHDLEEPPPEIKEEEDEGEMYSQRSNSNE
jgi:hypothetical protein